MKWVVYAVIVVVMGASWVAFKSNDDKITKLEEQIEEARNLDDSEGKLEKLIPELTSLVSTKTMLGILLTFLSAGIFGIIFVIHVLPLFAQRMTHAIYDSAEMIEKDVMHDARAKVAQGDYYGAIQAFKDAAQLEPGNRLPWVEIAKIQRENLEDPMGALETFRSALQGQEWEIEDAAYFLFRLVDMYEDVVGDRDTAVAILQQVIEEFPGTRHSANARAKLHNWGLESVADDNTFSSLPTPPPPAMLLNPESPAVVEPMEDGEQSDKTA